MTKSAVKAPNSAKMDYDYIAFSFNGKHSYDDFNIYRTSDGSRYNYEMIPTLTEKTAEVAGSDGMYYFGTQYKQKEFPISFAFDSLTEEKLHELRRWLNGKEMGELWFSESPYKIYTAKPTGKVTIKTIPFEEDGKRIYKGEGNITFTAYWPYAHTPDHVIELSEGITLPGAAAIVGPGEKVPLLQPLKAQYLIVDAKSEQIYFWDRNNNYVVPSSTSNNKPYKIDFGKEVEIVALSAHGAPDLTINSIDITDSSYKNPEPYLFHIPLNGKLLSSYKTFSNQSQWASASGLKDVVPVENGENFGELPAPFIFKAPPTLNNPNGLDYSDKSALVFRVGDMAIIVPARIKEENTTTQPPTTTYIHYNNIIWDSKTGIVSGNTDLGDESTRKPIYYTGVSIGAIPVEGIEKWGVSTIIDDTVTPPVIGDPYSTDCQLIYHYWYY